MEGNILANSGKEHITLRAAAAKKRPQTPFMALATCEVTMTLEEFGSSLKALLLAPEMRVPIASCENVPPSALATLLAAMLWKMLPLIAKKMTMPKSWAVSNLRQLVPFNVLSTAY